MDNLQQFLQNKLAEYKPLGRLWVAFSGGFDSHVLLDALAALRKDQTWQLSAVHVDHGLSPNSEHWSQHCAKICADLGVELQVQRVNALPSKGQSREAAARSARYLALRTLLQPGDYLATAHHRTDQAETLLLQLLRGSGPRGLAAMPECIGLGEGWLWRPLLTFSRAQLLVHAEKLSLEHIDDESNFDTSYERNWLRHQVVPVLQERRPGLEKALARTANLCADAERLMIDLAKLDLGAESQHAPEKVSIDLLRQLPDYRRFNMLRHWIRCQGIEMPDQDRLTEINAQALNAEADRQPCISWGGGEVRRFGSYLYAMNPLQEIQPGHNLPFDPKKKLDLPDGRCLQSEVTQGVGVSVARCQGKQLQVRFRQGGETIRPVGQGLTKKLKKLLQESNIPPWLRDRLALIYLEDTLVAVADLWIAEGFEARADESGYVFVLTAGENNQSG